jgi:hypothetical protein
METRIRLALRFGWTIVAVYGRLKHGIIWKRTPPKAPRLFISHLKLTSRERLLADTQRLLIIAEALFDDENLTPPDLIAGLPATIEAGIREGKAKLPPQDEIFETLDHWSLKCWAALNNEDTRLSEAASLGGSLADTYWHLPTPWQHTGADLGQTLQALLDPNRLTNLIRKVRYVDAYLPEGFGRMLRHSLWEWSIMGDLCRAATGELKIAYPNTYNLRSSQWFREHREDLIKKTEDIPADLNDKEKTFMRERVKKQAEKWERLVFDQSARPLMQPEDWRWVRWASTITMGVVTFLILLIGMLLLALLLRLGGWLIGFVLSVSPPEALQDWLTLGSAAFGVIGFLITQLYNGARELRQFYRWIRAWFLACKMNQCTLETWNGEKKSIAWIVIQRLMRPKDI